MNEPILERGMIGQTGGMGIFSKSGYIRDLDIKFPNRWRWIMISPNFDQFWGVTTKAISSQNGIQLGNSNVRFL